MAFACAVRRDTDKKGRPLLEADAPLLSPRGGLIGSAVLGVIFDMFGWTACVAGIAVSLLVAALLAVFLRTPMSPARA
jgi:hypothetical protein